MTAADAGRTTKRGAGNLPVLGPAAYLGKTRAAARDFCEIIGPDN